jgi:hypothetical protein
MVHSIRSNLAISEVRSLSTELNESVGPLLVSTGFEHHLVLASVCGETTDHELQPSSNPPSAASGWILTAALGTASWNRLHFRTGR